MSWERRPPRGSDPLPRAAIAADDGAETAIPPENPFYTAEMQGARELHSIGRFELEEGGVKESGRAAQEIGEHGDQRRDPGSAVGLRRLFGR